MLGNSVPGVLRIRQALVVLAAGTGKGSLEFHSSLSYVAFFCCCLVDCSILTEIQPRKALKPIRALCFKQRALYWV